MMVMTGAKPFVDDGRLRALATMSPKPWFNLPEVPPMAKAADLPGFSFIGWQGIVGPAQLPTQIRDRLNAAANAALKSPRVHSVFNEAGIQEAGGPPQELETTVKNDVVMLRKVMADAHLTFNQ